MTESATLQLSKSQYSESVIRKALYWLSEQCQWHLSDTDDDWQISIIAPQTQLDTYQATLQRLLNDFLLREKLDHSTLHLRSKIIFAALERIADD